MKSLNKSQKTKICKFILNNTECVVEKKYSDFLVGNVFPTHPDWKKKVGVGIDHLEVRNTRYGNKCFFIIRTDGTITDISYPAAISPHNKTKDIMAACRNAVSSMIELFRRSITLPFVCPVTGEVVTDRSNMHIDHYDLTFKELFDLWMKDKDVDELYRKTLKSNRDDCMDTFFDDEKVILDFIQFHNSHTHLRAVSKTANLSVLKRK